MQVVVATGGLHIGERSVETLLVGKPEGRRPPGRHRFREEDDIKVDLKEIRWECLDWIHLARDRDRWCAVMNTVTNF
jgi:hypothetical protein